MVKKNIVAVVFPLSNENIARFIAGKTTFVKFMSHSESVPESLKSVQTILFYETGKTKAITAKGTIISKSSELPKSILAKYKQSLFLSEDEFLNYVGTRQGKRMLVIETSNVKRLERSVKPPKTISLSGFYLNEEEYKSLLS